MTDRSPRLLPFPKRLRWSDRAERHRLSIVEPVFEFHPTGEDRFALTLLRETLEAAPGGEDSPHVNEVRLHLHEKPHPGFRPFAGDEAYQLRLEATGLHLHAPTARARYYAMQTLRQLTRSEGRELPAFQIEDWPDYPDRGFMLDVSRGRIPRMETMEELVELLGSLKYNQLQLYIEHTFAFASHPELAEEGNRLTPEEIRSLDEMCRRHHIELVPCLQSFGHAHRLLQQPSLAHLSESDFRGGWTLSPEEPGTYDLLRDLYADFLPHFSSPRFNACCDETWDLGKGKSRARAEREGLGRVYVDHILRVRELALAHKPRVMFWGDIIEKHADLISELPGDVTLLHWNYDTDGGEAKKYWRRLQPYVKAGRPFGVCPGTSSWNSLFFRLGNARENIERLARAGRKAGARSFLLTDWGDNGHYNFLSWSLWPIAWGAECAWRGDVESAEKGEEERSESAVTAGAQGAHLQELEPANFDLRFTTQLLGDPAGEFIEPVHRLGDLYRTFDVHLANHSPERWLLTGAPRDGTDLLGVERTIEPYKEIKPLKIGVALAAAEIALAELREIEWGQSEPDEVERDESGVSNQRARLIRDEWMLAARLCVHACRRGLLTHGRGEDRVELRRDAESLKEDFAAAWLRRNKRSELDRIRGDFDHIIAGYAARR